MQVFVGVCFAVRDWTQSLELVTRYLPSELPLRPLGSARILTCMVFQGTL